MVPRLSLKMNFNFFGYFFSNKIKQSLNPLLNSDFLDEKNKTKMITDVDLLCKISFV